MTLVALARLQARRLSRVSIEAMASLLTLTTIALIAAAAAAWLHSGYDGMVWSTPGYVVLSIEADSPAQRTGIRPGDKVLAVNGVPISQRFPLYDSGPGSSVTVSLQRGQDTILVPLVLGTMPARSLVLRLCNLTLAVVFSTLSFAFSFGQQRSRASLAFLLFYQLLALVIASGTSSGLQLPWAVRLLYIGLSLLGPASLEMAGAFPIVRDDPWLVWSRRACWVLGGLLAAPFLFLPLAMLRAVPSGYPAPQIVLTVLLLTVFLGLAVSAQSSRRAKDATAKAAVRISLLGLAISVLPFLAFYFVPRVAIGRSVVSAEVALLFLAALPLYHGFGITRRRLSGLEAVLPPLSAAVISGIWFAAALLATTWLSHSVWPAGGDTGFYAGVVLGAVVLAATNVSVISGARRMVHHAFFGQAYDYQSVVSEMSRDLAQAVGRKELARLVVGTLCQRMNLAGAALLSTHNSDELVEPEESSGSLGPPFEGIALRVDEPLVTTVFQENRPQRRESLRQKLASTRLRPCESELLDDERVAFWAPIVVRGSLRGIIVLGSKLKDALYSHDDLAIVATLVRQVGVSMENADLYDNLRAEMRKLQEMQDQLVQAEKLSAVGELVSGVAHELNNPLTAVIGYAELLRAEVADEQAKKDIENILRSAERCRRIVRNLLTFARRQKAERRMVDVNELIQQTIEIQAYQLRVDNIQLVSDFDAGLPHTAADSTQLQQVLLNIIMNAHQAIHSVRDRGIVRVSTRMLGGETIRVSISDDGPGIPTEVMSRVFDPFFTTKEVGVGTGLGLSICYGIVSGHGGRIWCESRLGEGATFIIELPVQRLQAIKEAAAERPPETRIGLKVLVVEDEVAVAAVLQRLLAKKGYVVEAASTGVEALKRLHSSQFDVIISDIKMPEMGGIALWENLKMAYPQLAARVIFVTGDTASLETSEFLKAAGQPVLPKPFGAEDLARAIDELRNQA